MNGKKQCQQRDHISDHRQGIEALCQTGSGKQEQQDKTQSAVELARGTNNGDTCSCLLAV